MMVAFGVSSPPTVLDLDGKLLRDEFDKDPGFFIENLEDQFSDDGLQGIHVWEGEPDVTVNEDDEGADYGCNLRKGMWREPTDLEWVALMKRRSPLTSDQHTLGSLIE